MKGQPIDERVSEYWEWITGALFLLITVDMITTVYAAQLHGAAAEVNPLMRWALQHGYPSLVGFNIAATALAAGIFYGLVRTLQEAGEETRWMLAMAIEVWLGLLLSAGLAIFANNLGVIVYGQSLF